MPFVAIPTVIMGEVRMLMAQQKIENRVMFSLGATVDVEAVTAVADLLRTWAEGTYMPLVTSSVELAQIVATDMSEQNGSQVSLPPTGVTIGGLGNAPMPNEVAFCVSLHTSSRGRSARGRFYAAGLDKGVVNSNNVTSAYRINIVSAVQNLIDQAEAAGIPVVIASLRNNNAPRPTPVLFNVLTAVATDDTVDSQRRRKPGVGQ